MSDCGCWFCLRLFLTFRSSVHRFRMENCASFCDKSRDIHECFSKWWIVFQILIQRVRRKRGRKIIILLLRYTEIKLKMTPNITGTDPEINQGGWLGYRWGFKLDLSYIVSITIAIKFKDMKWGSLAECWPSLFSVQKYALPLENFWKFALLRLNLEVVLTENYKNAGHL